MHLPPHFQQRYGPWALITGSSSGIGAEFARQLAAAGLNVVLTARRLPRLKHLADTLESHYRVRTRVVHADLSTVDGCHALLAAVSDLHIGLLVANAAFEKHGSFFRHALHQYLDMISLNCTAVTVLAHALGRRMAEERRGGILFVSSVASTPTPWWAVYGGTKAFVTNFGLTLRDELRPLGVDVMVLEPGLVKSEMSDHVGETISFSKMGLIVQPTHQCVTQALQSFVSGRARSTPGWMNKIFFTLFSILPTAWSITIMRWSHGYAMDQALTTF